MSTCERPILKIIILIFIGPYNLSLSYMHPWCNNEFLRNNAVTSFFKFLKILLF